MKNVVTAITSTFFTLQSAFAFEGRINATLTRGGETNTVCCTVGTNFVRVEMPATHWPNPMNVVDRNSGALSLLFPHNRSDRGIDADVANNLIMRNTARNNTLNYTIVANNKVGVIVSTPNSIAISGSAGGAGVGSTDPTANISY